MTKESDFWAKHEEICDIHGKVLLEYERGRSLVYDLLRGAQLHEANLKWKRFNGADLEGADLSGACIEGAKFRGANLKGANLSGIFKGRYSGNTGPDFSGANLSDSNLQDANLNFGNFTGANLEGANLLGANLESAKFEYAQLKRVKIEPEKLARIESEIRVTSFFPFSDIQEVKLKDGLVQIGSKVRSMEDWHDYFSLADNKDDFLSNDEFTKTKGLFLAHEAYVTHMNSFD